MSKNSEPQKESHPEETSHKANCKKPEKPKARNGRSVRQKGFSFEREIVNQAREKGLDAERAYASNGRAIGCKDTVDCMVSGMRIQAKRRKKLAEYIRIPDGADATIFREDRGETLVMMRYVDLLTLLSDANQTDFVSEN